MQGGRDDLANDDTPNKKCYFPLQVDDRGRGSKIQTLDDVICEWHFFDQKGQKLTKKSTLKNIRNTIFF